MALHSVEKWHVGKEIPLAVIFTICMQTCGLIWWAATMAAKIDNLSYQVASLTADKYTQTDARRDGDLWKFQIAEITRRIQIIETERKDHGNPSKQR